MNREVLQVRGAKVHNLRNVDCQIPHESLTVITGVSGSGKSSLAFDTIYAEGQRRYVESLSAYARQFLERIQKPDVEDVAGISPAIAIKQKNSLRNPRSTVATVTEIYDYLRLLFARIGRTFCWQCGTEVKKDVLDQAVSRLMALPPGTRLYILFPFAHYRRFQELRKSRSATKQRSGPREPELLKTVLRDLRRQGFNRLYREGRIYELSDPESLLDLDFSAPLEILVDRVVIRPGLRQRLADSLEICYREGSGHGLVEVVGRADTDPAAAPESGESEAAVGARFVFNEGFVCRRCHIGYEQPEPRLFSFNNPFGACPRCQGFGNTMDIDLKRVIPDPEKSLREGAVEPWTKPRYRALRAEFKRFAQRHRIPWEVPYRDLLPRQKELINAGDEKFRGIQRFFDYLETKKYKLYVRVFLSRYRGYTRCLSCNGSRLRAEARAVRIAGKEIGEATAMTVGDAREFFRNLRLTAYESSVAHRVLEELRMRLGFLYRVGLEYLTLDRLASTLSGGEAQRIQLATSLGSSLVGALYVLDEPSIGLHPRDNARLIEILKSLRDMGNTILVVEHEPAMIRSADRIIDMGPGAGEQGGQVVFSGDFSKLIHCRGSLTGKYLSGELEIPIPPSRSSPDSRWLRLYGAEENNLKRLDVEIPLGIITCITGVSGSGKSTLVHQVLYAALKARKGEAPDRGNYRRMEGDHWISDVLLVDQSPIGRTPRSNPVTYIKAFDVVRELFASTREARERRLSAGDFSFNLAGGRCDHCQGDGTVTVEMQFLADVELVCEECKGTRFKSSLLEVRYKGKNIHEVLQMTVREALSFFSAVPRLTRKLRVLEDVGLGYLRLGQSATTLSGGEAQRIKLAFHLSRQVGKNALYLFDEPTTGLHFDDVHKLLRVFRRLVRAGATILVIEHNLDVIKTADWIIDLGPEGGERGGAVVAAGPPERVAEVQQSHTGRFLKEVLADNGRRVN